MRCYDKAVDAANAANAANAAKADDSVYNKQINVFLETTSKLIPEYLVSYKFLIEKCKEFGLNIKESEMFSDTFKRYKSNMDELEEKNENLFKSIKELDMDVNKDLKRFSSFNRWCIFEKVE